VNRATRGDGPGGAPGQNGADGLTRTLIAAFGLIWRAHPGAFAGRLAVAVLGGLTPVAAAWLLRAILDLLVSGHPRTGLLVAVVSLGAVGGLQALLPNIGQYLTAQSGRATQRHATAELFTAVTRLAGLRRLEDPRFHDRLNVAQQAGSNAPAQIFSTGMAIAQAVLTLTGFLVTLVVLSPVIAVAVLLAALPGIYGELGVSRRRAALISGLSQVQRRQYFYANLLTDYAAAKEIRLFGLGAFFKGRMLTELREIQRANQRVDRRELVVYSVLAALGAVVAAGALVWAVFAAARGKLTVGDISVFVAALSAVAASLALIIASWALGYQSLLMFRSYREIVAEEPDLPQPAHPVKATALRRGIEFDDVWFRYGPDQPWILKGVRFFIPYGQAVALVGHNGAGKTTLVKLMCRFYDPDRGRITWDGVDLRDIGLAGLRDRVSVVFQDFMTYELTVTENIGVGDLRRAASSQAVTTAAMRAGIHETLASLPRGYDTLLTRMYFDLADRDDPQTGMLLSGGQWQRIGLARALMRADRDLLILDEPSSGLDAEAEHEIHRGLRGDRGEHATVLISHRLNTVRDADRIVVLADGIIGEQGSHDELMAQSGIYARLFSLQASGYAAQAAQGQGGTGSGGTGSGGTGSGGTGSGGRA
jgi:ATP-binding cassette, subfamily B, bacterial